MHLKRNIKIDRSNFPIIPNNNTKQRSHKFNSHDKYDLKRRLIHQAANELKSVLQKKTLTSATKSIVLHKIFDSKGDPRKESLAREIFREAMIPSSPTNGIVGDLGAEMLKFSIYSKHSIRSNEIAYKDVKNNEVKNLTTNGLLPDVFYRKASHVISHLKSRKRLEQQLRHELGKIFKRRPPLSRILKNNKTMKESGKNNRHYRIHTRIIHKPNHLPHQKFTELRKNNIKDGKHGAVLISVKSDKKVNNSIIDKQRQRKDFVIELDDDDSDQRNFDPILSLIERYAESHNHDISVVDEDENSDELRNIEDGFVTSKRRRFGENLFFNSLNEQEREDEEEEIPSNQFNDMDDPDADQFYSHRELGLLTDEEATEYENPPIYDDIMDSDVVFDKNDEEKRRRSRV